VASGVIIDVAPLLPPFMDAGDHSAILQRCSNIAVGKKEAPHGQSYVVPLACLKCVSDARLPQFGVCVCVCVSYARLPQ
jgi:hypothetical protein